MFENSNALEADFGRILKTALPPALTARIAASGHPFWTVS